MSLFKKRKTSNQVESRLSVQLGQVVARKQRKAAAYLNHKTQYWNRNSKIIALAVFCLLFGGSCLLLLLKSIIHF